MRIPEKASLLRILIGEDDRADGRPLYEAIVLRAREARLAGATVLRGALGFARSSVLHTTKAGGRRVRCPHPRTRPPPARRCNTRALTIRSPTLADPGIL
jgi:hypothetical protein